VSRSPKASTRATPKPAPFDRAGSPGCGPSLRTSRPGRRPWPTFCATPWAGRARAEGAHHRDAAMSVSACAITAAAGRPRNRALRAGHGC
jgi:hypothetical protein